MLIRWCLLTFIRASFDFFHVQSSHAIISVVFQIVSYIFYCANSQICFQSLHTPFFVEKKRVSLHFLINSIYRCINPIYKNESPKNSWKSDIMPYYFRYIVCFPQMRSWSWATYVPTLLGTTTDNELPSKYALEDRSTAR